MNIDLINPYTAKPLSISGFGLIESGDIVFPFKSGAYRVVDDNNYTESFGFQWNKFAETQIDKSINLDLSKKRFFSTTGWHHQDLSHTNILEVGSGAGRFTQIVLDQTKENLYTVGYSNAVEANYSDKPQKRSVKSWFARYGMEKVWGGYVKYENCDAAVVKGIKRSDRR